MLAFDPQSEKPDAASRLAFPTPYCGEFKSENIGSLVGMSRQFRRRASRSLKFARHRLSHEEAPAFQHEVVAVIEADERDHLRLDNPASCMAIAIA